MRISEKVIILALIILLGALLRLYKLSSFPVSLSWDEVAIGYNAFSISKTAKDEYGQKFPLLFKSFNDYKLPGYIYIDSVFVRVLGLSPLSVRLPSALFGTISIFFVLLIAAKLMDEKTAVFACLLFAVSPWSIQFSRAAFEANAAFALILAGLTLLLYGLTGKIQAFFSIPLLCSSIYFYYSPRIFVPVIIIVFFLLFKKDITKNLKYYLVGLALSALLMVPIAQKIFSTEGFKRVGEVSIFSDESQIVDYVQAASASDNPLSKIFLNRRIPVSYEALHNYFSHFSPGFLFFGDDPNARHKSAFHGNLYLFELPLVFIGLSLIINSKTRNLKVLIFSWLFIAPLPAALSRESPHALRSLLMLVPLIFLSATGINYILKWHTAKYILFPVIVISLINYLFTYYLIYPNKSSQVWAYGYRQMFEQVQKIEKNYDQIIVTGTNWKPYIFYLFYNQYDPSLYHAKSSQESIGKYAFGTAGWDTGGKDLNDEDINRLKKGNTLTILSPAEFNKLKNKENISVLEKIYDYSGKNEIFLIGSTR